MLLSLNSIFTGNPLPLPVISLIFYVSVHWDKQNGAGEKRGGQGGKVRDREGWGRRGLVGGEKDCLCLGVCQNQSSKKKKFVMNMMVSRVQMLKPRQLDGEMRNTYH